MWLLDAIGFRRARFKVQMSMYVMALLVVLAIVGLAYRQLTISGQAAALPSPGKPSSSLRDGNKPVSYIAKKLPSMKAADLESVAKGEPVAPMEQKLQELEARIAKLEKNAPKTFPLVKQLDYREKKRILVAGGAGFVGSHLVDYLMQQGHQVTVVDNFFTGSKRNIEHWLGHQNFELIHHDIVSPLYIEVDYIYNLASPASPPHYMMNPVKTIKTNTVGTINMLGKASSKLLP